MFETAEQTALEPRYLSMPDDRDITLPDVLDALADPVRLQIVHELAEGGEVACGALVVPVAVSTRSHHLRTLREAGLTRTRIVGTQRLVSLRRDSLDARFPGLLDAVVAAASG